MSAVHVFDPSAFDPFQLPDFEHEFIDQDDLDAFAKALEAPDASPVTALNDWKPVNQKLKRKPRKSGLKTSLRTKDEVREGFVYNVVKWPLLLIVLGWIIVLAISYMATRLYIWAYESAITWRGQREKLRRDLQSRTTYLAWKESAMKLDRFLGNDGWQDNDRYAYYNHATVRKVRDQLRNLRATASSEADPRNTSAFDEMRELVEVCMKNNFAGIENPRLYSETYFGTKALLQSFIDELDQAIKFLLDTKQGTKFERDSLQKYLDTNFGRTALCLSGGATFSYYHFGVVKALIDNDALPNIITGTSGGALVAALVGTRTDDELRRLLVPALAHKITACSENISVWLRRWWRTGARFDSLHWAKECSWYCRGSTTFREAYERTGRVLNITCIPSDPHSPNILANHLTAPNAVIWSVVLASAAVPGILNPIVLMMKTRSGKLAPYSFGHKWKDGSLRTDIPLQALNRHFNVNFSIVSQVNPHINLFFFSSRGTVGRPVTHRKGRGWRGGFLGSATEQYLKLDLTKWLKVLRHLELLPRLMGQDWSEIWLQKFSGTITIWPRTRLSDFFYILSDPSPERLARMIQGGQQSTFPKLLFIQNRLKLERRLTPHSKSNETISGDMIPNNDNYMQYQKPSQARKLTQQIANPEIRVRRGSSMFEELRNQTAVFFDDSDAGVQETEGSAAEDEEE